MYGVTREDPKRPFFSKPFSNALKQCFHLDLNIILRQEIVYVGYFSPQEYLHRHECH